MTIKIALAHHTDYQFDRQVLLSPHTIRLRPAPHSRTIIEAYSLRVEPTVHFLNWQQDPFGNYLARLVFQTPARRLRVDVDLIADMTKVNPFDFFMEQDAEKFPFNYDPLLRKDITPYLIVSSKGPLFDKRFAAIDKRRRNTIDFLIELNREIQNEIGYETRMEPGIQSCEQTLEQQMGSCRDSSWLLIQLLRKLGLAARFVSGYLVQLKTEGKPPEESADPKQDVADLHAWAEVYLPGAGWIGMDPTSGFLAGEGHIPLACTPDPYSAAPITGTTEPCEVHFNHSISVNRLEQTAG